MNATTTRHRGVLGLVGCIGLVAAIGGCSQPVADRAPTPDAFAQLVDTYLEGPAADGYGAEQVATLTSARAAGELTFEEYSAAVDASLECIADAGFYVERDPIDESSGYPMANYFYEGPEAGNPVADECIHVNSEAIEAVYQLQPSSVAAANAHLATQTDELGRCLGNEGIEVDFDGLEGDELKEAVHQALNDVLGTAADGSEPALACFSALTK